MIFFCWKIHFVTLIISLNVIVLFYCKYKGISLVDESSDLREDAKLQELTTGLQYAYTKVAVSASFIIVFLYFFN